jgi:hypothetical protein
MEKIMNANRNTAGPLEDVKIDVKVKLSALWVALVLLYIYADVRAFYEPGVIEQIILGEFEVGIQTSLAVWIGLITMTPPSVMVFLSLILRARANRWANIILGVFYTALTLITQFGIAMDTTANFLVSGIVEVVLTALIVWYAWKWPKQERVEVTQ